MCRLGADKVPNNPNWSVTQQNSVGSRRSPPYGVVRGSDHMGTNGVRTSEGVRAFGAGIEGPAAKLDVQEDLCAQASWSALPKPLSVPVAHGLGTS